MKRDLLTSCLIATIMLTFSSYAFASETYRVTEAYIRTPHFVGSAVGGLISDLINAEINYNLNEDDPADGYFDASFLLHIDGNNVTYLQALCPFPGKKHLTCTADNNHPDVMTTSARVPVPDGSHFDVITSPDRLTMSLMGIKFELAESRISWSIQKKGKDKKDKCKKGKCKKGKCKKHKIQGSVTGFISRKDAENIPIPNWVPFIGGWSYADVFDASELQTDSDGFPGWWFVLDFEAERVKFVN